MKGYKFSKDKRHLIQGNPNNPIYNHEMAGFIGGLLRLCIILLNYQFDNPDNPIITL